MDEYDKKDVGAGVVDWRDRGCEDLMKADEIGLGLVYFLRNEVKWKLRSYMKVHFLLRRSSGII